ncbi:sodium:solute symporter family transporter [Chroococcidiopsis cubana]|uniref:sodium:solute symporter family transporter n=1 Tax=Chroococcidiopsis cubana TaxID=171392 RepID=UPI001F5422B6
MAIGLSIVFKDQNVAYLVGLALAIAASANFPALLLLILWWRFTTQGAIASIAVGTASSLLLIYLSPTIQVNALFPLTNPAIISIPLTFIAAVSSLF